MATEQQKEVYSLMIPTVESNILLPNSNIAEIVPFSNVELFAESDGKPSWYLGHLLWRGLDIPLVSIDIIQGVSNPQADKRSRIAVVHTLNSNRELPYIAIVVQGIPRLSHVTQDNITLLAEQDVSDAEKMKISIGDVKASIPDLDKLEEMILAEKSAA